MKRCLLLLSVGLLLSACAIGGRKAPPTDIYDFGMPVERLPAADDWAGIALEIQAPHWFDSLAIEYRLPYDDPLQLRAYSGSRWAGAPAQLLAQRLRQQLGVASSRGQTATRCLLRFELQEFSQVFHTAQESRGVLHGQANLLDPAHRLVASRTFHSDRPAGTADARGGVAALVVAADDLGQALAAWLSTEEKRGTLRVCQSARADHQ
mgnify:CR=1 FL=1